MKKRSFMLIALLLACTFLMAAFAGCTPKDGDKTSEPTATPTAVSPDETEEPDDGDLTQVENARRAGDKSYFDFEVIIPADGKGDHPAFSILTNAKAALETIGITLTINDPAQSSVLWNALDAGAQDMWTAAWASTIDPDMYQVYHSSNIVGLGGSDSNHYHIADPDLDALILDARMSDDQAYRKAVYKQTLDKIIEWAVEVPNYQRKNVIIFSTERINIDTLTPDITTYWGWASEIETLEMAKEDEPLVVSTSDLTSKFSPFYADTDYDRTISSFTQIAMLTTDRLGGIIYNAIEGETVEYNGTDYLYTGPCDVTVNFDETANKTTYTIKMREDLKFSDGEAVTADDIIFTYYVFADPAYVGSTTLNSYNIVGLKSYQSQVSEELYVKYEAMADAAYAAGADYTVADGDAFTQEQYDKFYELLKDAWTAQTKSIVDYCLANYAETYAEDYVGKTAEEVAASEGLQIAFGMAAWGFGELDGEVFKANEKEFDLTDSFPTMEDYYEATYATYEGDAAKFYDTEKTDTESNSVLGQAYADFIQWAAELDPDSEGGVPNIAGIVKVDDYTVEVTTEGYEAPAVYTICGLDIAPMHYYGDKAQYDYANNKFGHPFGDLSIVESKTTQPMGAGAYVFDKYENKVVYYTANEHYYKGEPKIKDLQIKEVKSDEVAVGVQTGTLDCGELTGTVERFQQIKDYNDNGEITGNVITTSSVDNLGYGYLGLNADSVCVGGDPASDQSKNLRRALATVLAVYRDVANNSYYGEVANTIQYPISNTSWAAPQPTDPDYEIAFSVDVDGNPIYTADMTQEQKEEAALQAALGFFEAAGYTVKSGKVVGSPAN